MNSASAFQQGRCRLDARARRAFAAANQVSEAQQIAIRPPRIQVATGIEIPRPVPSATYAARHIGHLGSSARMAVGTIHFVVTIARRVVDLRLLTRVDAPWQQA